MAKIKKGDKVIVLTGRDRNKTGQVEKVFSKTSEILVGGINMVKKHVKVSQKNTAGGVIEVQRPMPVSKVALVCPSCNKATRVGFTIKKDGKERMCKKCQKAITAKTEKGDK
jgi:large subunit ribosomal protein L24